MSSVSRYQYLLIRFATGALVVAALVGAVLYRAWFRLPVARQQPPGSIGLVNRLASTNYPASPDWSVFQSRDGSEVSSGASCAGKFRLAGTFFEYLSDVSGTGDVRKAVIDDLKAGVQVIVREGEKVADSTLVKIFRDRVVMRDANGTDEQLWLTFSGLQGSPKAASGGTNAPVDGAKLAAADKFGGQQLGDSRWLFSREKLMEYYKELRDEPERLVKVFDSLKPVYTAPGKISGYQLGIEGEAEFFKAVGLQQGDIVRGVNSMQMTNRRRAEYFIGEFVADRANAFVMDVERGGKTEKLTYEVR